MSNLAISLIQAVKLTDERLYQSLIWELEARAWADLDPRHFISGEDSFTSIVNYKRITDAVFALEQLTKANLLEKDYLISKFTGYANNYRERFLANAKELGTSPEAIEELLNWYNFYQTTVTDILSETLHPRPKLEPEVNASSAA
jgi:hypothetical protein